MSIINQLSLTFFVTRLIHLVVSSSERSSSSTVWKDFLCKLLNYLLSSSTRMVYWLTSLISIERVYTTIFFNGRWLKKPHIARRVIVLTLFSVLISDIYELFFYKSLSNVKNGQGSICVLKISKYNRSLWMTFHLFFLILNSVLPFLINLCSTITISLIVVNQKMKTNQSNRRKLHIISQPKLDIDSKICT